MHSLQPQKVHRYFPTLPHRFLPWGYEGSHDEIFPFGYSCCSKFVNIIIRNQLALSIILLIITINHLSSSTDYDYHHKTIMIIITIVILIGINITIIPFIIIVTILLPKINFLFYHLIHFCSLHTLSNSLTTSASRLEYLLNIARSAFPIIT